MVSPVEPGFTGVLVTTATGRVSRACREALESFAELCSENTVCEFAGAQGVHDDGPLLGVQTANDSGTADTASTLSPKQATPQAASWVKVHDTGVRNTFFVRIELEQAPRPVELVKLLFEQTRKQGYVAVPSCESFFPIDVVCKAYTRHAALALADHVSAWLQAPMSGTHTKPCRFAVRFRSRNNDRVQAHDFIDVICRHAVPLIERGLARVDLTEPDVIIYVHILGKLCCCGAVPRELHHLSSPRLNIHACIPRLAVQEKRAFGEPRIHAEPVADHSASGKRRRVTDSQAERDGKSTGISSCDGVQAESNGVPPP